MQPSSARTLLRALALSVVLAGCDRAPGTIRGDVFIAENIGQEINLTHASVRLLEDSGSDLDSALARICPTRAAPGTFASPAQQEQAWRERERILDAQTLRTVRTDARASFALDSVPPGTYRLWADTTIGSTRWTWLERVRVPGGDTVRLNLSNANPDENPFRCG